MHINQCLGYAVFHFPASPDVLTYIAYSVVVLFVFWRQGYAEHVSRPSELPMLDLVLVVKDSEDWHQSNLDRSAGARKAPGESEAKSIQAILVQKGSSGSSRRNPHSAERLHC